MTEIEIEEEVAEKTEFTFAELSETAKQKAIEWYAEGQSADWEPDYDDILRCFGFLGIEVSSHPVKLMNGKTRQEPDIHYAISWSQGDGATFEGTWAAERMDLAGLHAYAPQDDTLHRLGAKLLVVLLCHPDATAKITTTRYGPGLESMGIEDAVTGEADAQGDELLLAQELVDMMDGVMDALAGWIYDQLRDELEHQTSEEVCIEGIEANDTTFDEDGRVI
jgi:hypothetical protein